MKSSQALTQSVFGSLHAIGRLDVLAEMPHDPFRLRGRGPLRAELEHSINYLGETQNRCTSVDVLFSCQRRIVVECKLAESDVGHCSRPKLAAEEPDHCDGTYRSQRGRSDRCSLTAIGIRYWEYIPQILNWNPRVDLSPCPLSHTYQIVRNLLAACVLPGGGCSPENGVAVLVVDARNPTFSHGGRGRSAFDQIKTALLDPHTLQVCTWQDIVGHMRSSEVLTGLTEQIREKYGI
jgi:hypothetical protein